MLKIILSFTILFCSFLAQSQIKFGPIIGYNHNMPKYETTGDSLNNQTAAGKSFSGGIFGSYELDDHFEVMAELLISGRHHNSTLIVENSNNGFNYYEEHFTSVGTVNFELPIMAAAKMDFRRGKYGDKKTLSGYVGPVFMMNLSDNYYRSSGYRVTVYNQETIVKEEVTESPIDYRQINLGLVAGVQYEFGFGLRVGARFQTNFMTENTNTDFDLRYSQLQFNLGYTIFK